MNVKTEQAIDIDVAVDAYMRAAIFSTLMDNGEPFDDKYTIEKFDDVSKQKMRADVVKFVEENKEALLCTSVDLSDEKLSTMIGFNFWMDRNGHGVGFWEEEYYGKEISWELSKKADAFGQCTLLENGKHVELL